MAETKVDLASWNSWEHPRWPKKTPGGKGGEFMDKGGIFGVLKGVTFYESPTGTNSDFVADPDTGKVAFFDSSNKGSADVARGLSTDPNKAVFGTAKDYDPNKKTAKVVVQGGATNQLINGGLKEAIGNPYIYKSNATGYGTFSEKIGNTTAVGKLSTFGSKEPKENTDGISLSDKPSTTEKSYMVSDGDRIGFVPFSKGKGKSIDSLIASTPGAVNGGLYDPKTNTVDYAYAPDAEVSSSVAKAIPGAKATVLGKDAGFVPNTADSGSITPSTPEVSYKQPDYNNVPGLDHKYTKPGIKSKSSMGTYQNVIFDPAGGQDGFTTAEAKGLGGLSEARSYLTSDGKVLADVFYEPGNGSAYVDLHMSEKTYAASGDAIKEAFAKKLTDEGFPDSTSLNIQGLESGYPSIGNVNVPESEQSLPGEGSKEELVSVFTDANASRIESNTPAQYGLPSPGFNTLDAFHLDTKGGNGYFGFRIKAAKNGSKVASTKALAKYTSNKGNVLGRIDKQTFKPDKVNLYASKSDFDSNGNDLKKQVAQDLKAAGYKDNTEILFPDHENTPSTVGVLTNDSVAADNAPNPTDFPEATLANKKLMGDLYGRNPDALQNMAPGVKDYASGVPDGIYYDPSLSDSGFVSFDKTDIVGNTSPIDMDAENHDAVSASFVSYDNEGPEVFLRTSQAMYDQRGAYLKNFADNLKAAGYPDDTEISFVGYPAKERTVGFLTDPSSSISVPDPYIGNYGGKDLTKVPNTASSHFAYNDADGKVGFYDGKGLTEDEHETIRQGFAGNAATVKTGRVTQSMFGNPVLFRFPNNGVPNPKVAGQLSNNLADHDLKESHYDVTAGGTSRLPLGYVDKVDSPDPYGSPSPESSTSVDTPSDPTDGNSSGDGFPTDPDSLKLVSNLGGSTGAKLYEDAMGNRFVKKSGASPGHLREEAAVNAMYSAAGIATPEEKLYDDPDSPSEVFKLAKFVEGVELGSLGGQAKKDAEEKIRRGFAADALFGNWDVIGMNRDNILMGGNGSGDAYRIDNGGSLRYRAMGSLKHPSMFDKKVGELDTMRDKKKTAGKVFGSLTDEQVADQIYELDAKRDAIIEAAPEDLKDIVASRLDYMKDWSKKKGFDAPATVADDNEGMNGPLGYDLKNNEVPIEDVKASGAPHNITSNGEDVVFTKKSYNVPYDLPGTVEGEFDPATNTISIDGSPNDIANNYEFMTSEVPEDAKLTINGLPNGTVGNPDPPLADTTSNPDPGYPEDSYATTIQGGPANGQNLYSQPKLGVKSKAAFEDGQLYFWEGGNKSHHSVLTGLKDGDAKAAKLGIRGNYDPDTDTLQLWRSDGDTPLTEAEVAEISQQLPNIKSLKWGRSAKTAVDVPLVSKAPLPPAKDAPDPTPEPVLPSPVEAPTVSNTDTSPVMSIATGFPVDSSNGTYGSNSKVLGQSGVQTFNMPTDEDKNFVVVTDKGEPHYWTGDKTAAKVAPYIMGVYPKHLAGWKGKYDPDTGTYTMKPPKNLTDGIDVDALKDVFQSSNPNAKHLKIGKQTFDLHPSAAQVQSKEVEPQTKPVYFVSASGNTFPVKSKLKADGFKFKYTTKSDKSPDSEWPAGTPIWYKETEQPESTSANLINNYSGLNVLQGTNEPPPENIVPEPAPAPEPVPVSGSGVNGLLPDGFFMQNLAVDVNEYGPGIDPPATGLVNIVYDPDTGEVVNYKGGTNTILPKVIDGNKVLVRGFPTSGSGGYKTFKVAVSFDTFNDQGNWLPGLSKNLKDAGYGDDTQLEFTNQWGASIGTPKKLSDIQTPDTPSSPQPAAPKKKSTTKKKVVPDKTVKLGKGTIYRPGSDAGFPKDSYVGIIEDDDGSMFSAYTSPNANAPSDVVIMPNKAAYFFPEGSMDTAKAMDQLGGTAHGTYDPSTGGVSLQGVVPSGTKRNFKKQVPGATALNGVELKPIPEGASSPAVPDSTPKGRPYAFIGNTKLLSMPQSGKQRQKAVITPNGDSYFWRGGPQPKTFPRDSSAAFGYFDPKNYTAILNGPEIDGEPEDLLATIRQKHPQIQTLIYNDSPFVVWEPTEWKPNPEFDDLPNTKKLDRLLKTYAPAYQNNLTAKERSAVTGYQGSSEGYNRPLRKGKPVSANQQEKNENLDTAMLKMPTPEDMVVYRAMGHNEFQKTWLKRDKDPDKMIGYEWTDPGWLGTTSSKLDGTGSGGVSGFTNSPSKAGMEPGNPHFPTYMKVRLPKGTPAFYARASGKFPGEEELILARNIRWRVIGAWLDQHGSYWVETEIVGIGVGGSWLNKEDD